MLTSLKADMAEAGRYAPDIKMRGLAIMLLLDIGIPVVAYFVARAGGLGATPALFVATIVSGLRMGWIIWRQKHIDGFSVFMVAIFAGGLLLSVLTGDPRYMLAKACVATILGGVVFVGSVAMRRPLTFTVGRRMAAGDQESLAALERGWSESAPFRRGFYLMGLVWGFGLILESVLRLILIYRLSLDAAVIWTTVISVMAYVVLGGWNVWYIEHSRKLARQQLTQELV